MKCKPKHGRGLKVKKVELDSSSADSGDEIGSRRPGSEGNKAKEDKEGVALAAYNSKRGPRRSRWWCKAVAENRGEAPTLDVLEDLDKGLRDLSRVV